MKDSRSCRDSMGCFGRHARLWVILIGLLLLIPASVASAVPENLDDVEVRERNVVGEVGVIRPDYITVVYESDEKSGRDFEMLLRLDAQLNKTYEKEIERITPGARVQVNYDEYFWTTDTGVEKRDTQVTGIRFISPKKQGLRSN